MTQMFEAGLGRRDANYVPLTPIDFLVRAAEVYGERLAVVHGDVRRTWGETHKRAKQLASALAQAGVARGDTVAAVLPNIPAMVEAHFGVPMAGAVLNTINTRLDISSVLFMLRHGEAKVLIVDTEYADLAHRAAREVPGLKIVSVADAMPADPARFAGATDYEAFVAGGDPDYAWTPPADEWEAIALNYTSGTTGDPKGVVYHHRGAYLAAISNILEWDMPKHAVYLWTLPMFHCNGWCFPWAVAARAGVNVCLRKFDAKTVFDLIRSERITHYCGAPIVQSAIANAPAEFRAGIDHTVHAMVAGAAPAPAVIAKMKEIGFDLLHVYGLTEVYGPATVCAKQAHWDALPDDERARLNARQGVRYHLEAGATVLDPDTMTPVPADGETLGEIMFRGNICMKGYLKNPKATDEAFHGGWFHTGDLGVLTPDGYIRIKDRRKDIIISGGENISSIEVEDALYRHPAVAVAAVVAMPDPKWGEVPCAFVELREGASATEEEIVAHCKQLLAGFKVPKAVRFGELPKTSTGKIQKFQLRNEVGSGKAIDLAGDKK
ncbi:AMP-binding enzyme family protein [Burkholderia ambifaria AMMD]|uniref:AMP-dependent synthetase and ligase n=1 Tax=Burkholderia ambifaria (strain ATCC BAA-244 / DSM 16087 / CCUG 44356 / LMG 19182 / AMMD) TaxID=339670 RepID=Q0B9A6_BURCM|nr:acyl-CoA synthetase [Burkholderia ambifaria]ABI89267.1 AMP-dependent synthetase and ligase [Burkholderia ambifaria AMMD]AJY25222.1 AMP-binding enzyme family protein [Burkholderia ambifaria AMMD]MBR7930774.1 acyl-CoA synthetase [Burkholderia ambifaria]PEH69530.1 acyl-CoA synthetase [Burkholderia ambifaria]QQC08042.1 acyl-CoA synthetase [Burkholderia ambifaria]